MISPARRDACSQVAASLSGFADGSVNGSERTRVAAHLPGCERCREVVRELRDVRDRLRGDPGTVSAPEDLTTRLVSIAGPESGRPLGIVASGDARLPSRRRRRQRAVAIAASATTLTLAGAAALGWAAAPPLIVADADGVIERPRVLPTAQLSAGSRPAEATPNCASDWICGYELAGLPLRWQSVDRLNHPTVVRAVYGATGATISLVQRRGVLERVPDAVEISQGLWRRGGSSPLYAWQSGETVITLVLDGTDSLAGRAIAELPHEPPLPNDPMSRWFSGWAHLRGAS